MHKVCFRILLVLATIWESGPVAQAASLDLPHSRPLGRNVTERSGPCRSGHESTAPWRAQISRRSALYIIQRIQRACQILVDRWDKGPQLNPILDDLYATVLRPIYRAHPELEQTAFRALSRPKLLRATPHDIGRATASRLANDIPRLQQQISRLGGENLDQYADKDTAERALQPFLDAVAELSFAQQIAFDAYPDLFAKQFDIIPQQPRTEQADANYRKVAPPHGSVRLSDSALALIKSFMQQTRHYAPKDDYVASIGWAREQKSKSPGDAHWVDKGPGWILGAYSRKQVPPDVIDRVRDIDIVFAPEDPSSLAGKMIDCKDKKLLVHD